MATRQQATLPSSSSSYTINETSNVTIQPSLTASGNGLFATKHIPAGSTILVKSRPLVGELDIERLRDSCHGCFVWRFGVDVDDERKGRVVVKVCTGCRKVRYCSKVCFFLFLFVFVFLFVFLLLLSHISKAEKEVHLWCFFNMFISFILLYLVFEISLTNSCSFFTDMSKARLDQDAQDRVRNAQRPYSSPFTQRRESDLAVGDSDARQQYLCRRQSGYKSSTSA
jgi:hypothetical protein